MPEEIEKIGEISRSLSKHAYSDAIEAISRIACFATSRNLKFLGRGDYYDVGLELLKRDLVILAISIRRLAELTKSQGLLKSRHLSVLVHTEEKTAEKSENCWNLIGNVVHGLDIEIYKDLGRIRFDCREIDFWTYRNTTEECDAAISIKSDKHGSKVLKVSDFLIQINSYAEEANDILSANGVYVGSTWDD